MNPTTLQTLQDLQANFTRAAAAYRELMAIAREAQSCPPDACPAHLRPFRYISHDPAPQFTRLARRTAQEVVEVVRGDLAGPNGLELDGHEEIVGRFFDEDLETLPAEGFCCVELGQAIYDAFAERAPAMALRQSADRVLRLFGLVAGEAPAVRAGCVVLSLRMYTDRWAGRLTYSNDRELVEASQALADVVRTIDAEKGRQMQQAIQNLISVGHSNGWAPERMAYGPIGPVGVRSYQSKVEFLVPVALAAGINAFLSEHGSGFKARVAITA
ncbi:MAG: hypothetical protein BGP10_04610 [Rhodanobacter sp. 68-29]|nr:hypothetical protein [Rhodanobacter sp.]OJY61789.1 MAG: hypothetical protein BGP10_04610 [Rhodanobacter sp. 68-29]